MLEQCQGIMQRRSRRAGFTLVEAMIASALFFVISGGFIAAYISGMRTHRMASDYYRAICIARNRIQRARTLEYDSLNLLTEIDRPVDQNGNPSIDGQFRRTTLVSNTVPECTMISVDVNFPLPGGGVSAEGMQLHTMITEGM